MEATRVPPKMVAIQDGCQEGERSFSREKLVAGGKPLDSQESEEGTMKACKTHMKGSTN